MQVKPKHSDAWHDTKEPEFHDSQDYRIKPESQLIPFDFSDAEILIGRAVKSNDGKIVSVITDLTRNTVWMSASDKSYNELLSEFTFLNGTPCGKEGQS